MSKSWRPSDSSNARVFVSSWMLLRKGLIPSTSRGRSSCRKVKSMLCISSATGAWSNIGHCAGPWTICWALGFYGEKLDIGKRDNIVPSSGRSSPTNENVCFKARTLCGVLAWVISGEPKVGERGSCSLNDFKSGNGAEHCLIRSNFSWTSFTSFYIFFSSMICKFKNGLTWKRSPSIYVTMRAAKS